MAFAEWLGRAIDDVRRERTIDFTVTSALTQRGNTQTPTSLVAGDSYLSIKVKCLRLPNSREFTSRYYGVVHSFANVARRGRAAAEFVSATTPAALSTLDPRNVSRVISIDRQVVGPTPWDGGDLRLQIGLFSVVEQELAGPFLQTITALSDRAGVALSSAAAPFVDIISGAVSALAAKVGSVRLEIGMDRTGVPVPGHYAVIAAPKAEVAGAKLELDEADGKLLLNGIEFKDHAYLVYTVESTSRQDRWGEIEELRSAYQHIEGAMRERSRERVRSTLQDFKIAATMCSDLTPKDAKRLVGEVEQSLQGILGEAEVSAKAGTDQLPPFGSLKLYPS
ncbi:hypothetical protein ACFX5Q_23500 [Mesorhizobium sp. IMUNJ 23033]|uniref:hypothetical protein n=1 Tax=Mesorhizobium sp. IMUNJ 23033 TaxID=3378039 RepID=UPI00384CF91C